MTTYTSQSLHVYDALLRRIEGMPEQITRLTLNIDISHGAMPFVDVERAEVDDDGKWVIEDGNKLPLVNERYFLFCDGEKVQARKV